MNVVRRVRDLLLRPRSTWHTIASEPGDVATVYRQHVVVVAAIPAIAGFVGMSLVGLGHGFRVPIVSGLVQLLLGYVIALAMVYVLALVVDALAPTFGGTRNRANAVKVVAYGLTASWVGGVFLSVPAFAPLSLIVSLYSVVLLHLGLAVLMHGSRDRSVPYTAVVVLAGLVLVAVANAIARSVLPVQVGLIGA